MDIDLFEIPAIKDHFEFSQNLTVYGKRVPDMTKEELMAAFAMSYRKMEQLREERNNDVHTLTGNNSSF
jgi:hypothetical protein